MSHLILKKVKGGYQSYNKYFKKTVGPVMTDYKKAQAYNKKRDAREDKINERMKK